MKIIKNLLLVTLILTFAHGDATPEETMKTLELSLSECLDIGIGANIDIKIARLEAMIAKQDILLSEAIFDTILSGRTTYANDERATPSPVFGSKSIAAEYGIGVDKTFPTGTELSLDWSDIRSWSDSTFVNINPYHTAEISLSIEQPILKNFFGYIDRAAVKIAKVNFEIADIRSLDKIETAVADIEKAYWWLVLTYENLALRESLLNEAEKLYEIFERHVKTGAAESTEFYETEANMHIRKTELMIAQNRVKTASNQLSLLLNEDESLLIAPRDRLVIFGDKADLAESLNTALIANREYRIKKKSLEEKEIQLKMKENSLWPEIDLVGTLALNGVDGKFEKAEKRLSTDKFPYYYGGIKASFPLENSAARAEYKKASLDKEKVVQELIYVEKKIITDVDDKVRGVNLNLVTANHWITIRDIQKVKFDEESKKLKYGRSSSKTIVDYQNDLLSASLNEYAAVLNYYYSLIDLENAKDTLLERVGVTK